MESRSLTELRHGLSRFITEAVTTHARFLITRNGKRAAVLMSAYDYDALMETIDVLSDPDLVRNIHTGLRDAEASRVFTHDEVLAELAERNERTRRL